MTKFLLDSGDPQEYKEIIKLAKNHDSEIWGATTNPTLIAKNFAGKKFTKKQAFDLQKEIVMEILKLVPGAVSAEVYADEATTAVEMIRQGEEIATWDKRIYVKLPTTIESFKARTALREKNININNTLVFSQQQIFVINLHEQIIRANYSARGGERRSGVRLADELACLTGANPARAPAGSKATEDVGVGKRETGPRAIKTEQPQFISPFIGRLEDNGVNGMRLIEHGMKLKSSLTWMLAASIRTVEHIQQSIKLKAELITAPAKTYRQWFAPTPPPRHSRESGNPEVKLKDIPFWQPPEKLKKNSTIEEFMDAIQTNCLDIRHPLTAAGLTRFAADWKAILKN